MTLPSMKEPTVGRDLTPTAQNVNQRHPWTAHQTEKKNPSSEARSFDLPEGRGVIRRRARENLIDPRRVCQVTHRQTSEPTFLPDGKKTRTKNQSPQARRATKTPRNSERKAKEPCVTANSRRQRETGPTNCNVERAHRFHNALNEERMKLLLRAQTFRGLLCMGLAEGAVRQSAGRRMGQPTSVRSKVLSAFGRFPDFGTIKRHGNTFTQYTAMSLKNKEHGLLLYDVV